MLIFSHTFPVSNHEWDLIFTAKCLVISAESSVSNYKFLCPSPQHLIPHSSRLDVIRRHVRLNACQSTLCPHPPTVYHPFFSPPPPPHPLHSLPYVQTDNNNINKSLGEQISSGYVNFYFNIYTSWGANEDSLWSPSLYSHSTPASPDVAHLHVTFESESVLDVFLPTLAAAALVAPRICILSDGWR